MFRDYLAGAFGHTCSIQSELKASTLDVSLGAGCREPISPEVIGLQSNTDFAYMQNKIVFIETIDSTSIGQITLAYFPAVPPNPVRG